MYISEISAGTIVELEAVVGNTKLEFESLAVTIEDKQQLKLLEQATKSVPYAAIEAIRKDDKVIGFPSQGVVYKVTNVAGESQKAFEWPNIKVKQVGFPTGEKYHILISANEGKEVNRRERYRLWLGCDAIAQIGLNKTTYNVVIKDISATGISFILDKRLFTEGKTPPKVETTVVLTFYDTSTETHFRLTAKIVRIVDMDETRNLYGCQLLKESEAISKFIYDKQRERAKIHSRNGAEFNL